MAFYKCCIAFAAGDVPCVGRKMSPVHNCSADYIFWRFVIIVLILSQFENRVPLKPVQGGVGSVTLHYCI